MAKATPKPWRYVAEDVCGSTGEEYGNIIASDGTYVASEVYKSDAEEIPGLQPEAGERFVIKNVDNLPVRLEVNGVKKTLDAGGVMEFTVSLSQWNAAVEAAAQVVERQCDEHPYLHPNGKGKGRRPHHPSRRFVAMDRRAARKARNRGR